MFWKKLHYFDKESVSITNNSLTVDLKRFDLGAQKNRIIDVCIHNCTSARMRDQTVFTIVCVINYKAIFGMGMIKIKNFGGMPDIFLCKQKVLELSLCSNPSSQDKLTPQILLGELRVHIK